MGVVALVVAGLAVAQGFVSSAFLPIDRMPFDTGRYLITVDQKPNSLGGIRFIVTLRPKKAPLPENLRASLSEIERKDGSVSISQKRELKLVGKGQDRTITFDASKEEIARWSFQLDEIGKTGGRPIPSLTCRLFPLNQPPQPAHL